MSARSKIAMRAIRYPPPLIRLKHEVTIGPGESAVYRTRMAALGLKPRRQIRQPLRGGVNEHGLQVLVETSEDESTDKNEKHAKRHLHGMAYRQGPLAPALQRFARQKPDDQ